MLTVTLEISSMVLIKMKEIAEAKLRQDGQKGRRHCPRLLQ